MKNAMRKYIHVAGSRRASLTCAVLNSDLSRVSRSRARRSVAILRSVSLRNHAVVVSTGMMKMKRTPMSSDEPSQMRNITRQLAMAMESASPTRYIRTAPQIVARPPEVVHHLVGSLAVVLRSR